MRALSQGLQALGCGTPGVSAYAEEGLVSSTSKFGPHRSPVQSVTICSLDAWYVVCPALSDIVTHPSEDNMLIWETK